MQNRRQIEGLAICLGWRPKSDELCYNSYTTSNEIDIKSQSEKSVSLKTEICEMNLGARFTPNYASMYLRGVDMAFYDCYAKDAIRERLEWLDLMQNRVSKREARRCWEICRLLALEL